MHEIHTSRRIQMNNKSNSIDPHLHSLSTLGDDYQKELENHFSRKEKSSGYVSKVERYEKEKHTRRHQRTSRSRSHERRKYSHHRSSKDERQSSRKSRGRSRSRSRSRSRDRRTESRGLDRKKWDGSNLESKCVERDQHYNKSFYSSSSHTKRKYEESLPRHSSYSKSPERGDQVRNDISDTKERKNESSVSKSSIEQVLTLPDAILDESSIAKLMGFESFTSTKGEHVIGSNVSAVDIKKVRKYRQYMNKRLGKTPSEPV